MDRLDSHFVNALYQEVREFHANLPNSVRERGFSIFFNPPVTGGLLIIGLNPRRQDSLHAQSHPEAQQGPPAKHLYFDPSRAGKTGENIRKLFENCDGGEDWSRILLSSNKINALFFGSKGVDEWRSDEFWEGRGDLRIATESRCLEWLHQIIQQVRPSSIVVEGMSTFESYIHPSDRISTAIYNRSSGAAVSGAIEGIPTLAIAHPSRYNANHKLVKPLLSKFLKAHQ